MVDIVQQICIKSFEIKAQNGDHFKAKQGKEYTTTVPSNSNKTITVFSNFWVPAPKANFVLVE